MTQPPRRGLINAQHSRRAKPHVRGMRTAEPFTAIRDQVPTVTERQYQALTAPQTDADEALADATIAKLKRSIRVAKGDLPDYA